MAEGFLGRWSQRKQDVREGKPLAEPVQKPVQANVDAAPALATLQTVNQADQTITVAADKPEVALPTMEDVRLLTPDSDFAPFVARNVSPEVRNTAMKKLFTDPHYNVMDRLDIYIDDYSKPDPMPLSMIRQMTSAKFLNLFDDEEENAKKMDEHVEADSANTLNSPLRNDANPLEPKIVSPSEAANLIDTTQETKQKIPHDYTDLRLQQNHAAEPHQLGRGTE